MVFGSIVVGVFVALCIFGSIGCFVILVVLRSIVPIGLPVGASSSFDTIVLLCGLGGSVMLGLAILLYFIFRRR